MLSKKPRQRGFLSNALIDTYMCLQKLSSKNRTIATAILYTTGFALLFALAWFTKDIVRGY